MYQMTTAITGWNKQLPAEMDDTLTGGCGGAECLSDRCLKVWMFVPPNPRFVRIVRPISPTLLPLCTFCAILFEHFQQNVLHVCVVQTSWWCVKSLSSGCCRILKLYKSSTCCTKVPRSVEYQNCAKVYCVCSTLHCWFCSAGSWWDDKGVSVGWGWR